MAKKSAEYDIPLKILSIKDRKILKELFEDARRPFSVIARRVGLSKEVVNYRMKRLLERGILRGFNTVIDVNTLGWQMFFAHVQLRNIDNEGEEAIIQELVSNPHIAQVLKCIGNYDLVLKLFVKDYAAANALMKQIEKKFKTSLDTYSLNLIEQEALVPLPFLYQPILAKEPEMPTSKGQYAIDEKELQILKCISHDARASTSSIGKTLGISRELVSYHLKKLEKNKVIVKHRPSAWSGSKSIGYSWYMVMLKLNEFNPSTQKRLQYYILNNPHMTYLYRTIGSHDVQFEIRLQTSDELNEVLMEIRSILKKDLKSHELAIILKEFKYTYFPECLATTKR